MFKSHLKIALRHLIKRRGFAFINIAGLAVGMACSLLILLWVWEEYSYDRFHEKADRIVRVCARGRIGDTVIDQTSTCAPLPGTLMMDYPEVEQAVRILRGNAPVQYGDRVFVESGMLIADSTFFDVFSFPLLRGDRRTVLSAPDACVITQTMARKYFGDEDPINKVLTVAGYYRFRVTGIMKEVPANSHVHFNGVFSLASVREMSANDAWMSNSFATYLVLREGFPYRSLEAKFPDFIRRHFGPDESKIISAAGNKWEYYLQPLTSIHLDSHVTSELEPNGNRTYVTFFILIAAFILCIASVNFMNLATAKSSLRSREVGVRKASGASRLQLVRQFLSESVFTVFLAAVLSVGIMELAMPAFNNLTGKALSLGSLAGGTTLPVVLALVLVLGVLSGSYPAFFLSSFKPVAALKGQPSEGAGKSRLRNGLVLFQFSISIILFVGTLMVHRQLVYMQAENLGFSAENILVIRNYSGVPNRSFKAALRECPGVVISSGSETVPGYPFRNMVATPEQWKEITLDWNACDCEFLETMGMRMAQGRFFSRDFGADTSAIVINETAARLLGWKDPLGKIIWFSGRPLTVIGTVRDFHYESKLNKIEPSGMVLLGSPGFTENAVVVKLRTENVPETVSAVKALWDRHVQGTPFDYGFLDEEYDNLYRNEMRTEKIFAVFSCLAIAIACLGLFGLSAFAAERRTKEICIRNVLGASVANLAALLSYEFTQWVVWANLLAWPVAWYAMKRWLQNFAYQIPMDWRVFLLSGLLALAVALLTVIYQAVRAATANPVDSLKYE